MRLTTFIHDGALTHGRMKVYYAGAVVK